MFLTAIHCRHCHTEFTPSRKNQIYCSPKCRLAHFTEKKFSFQLSHLQHVFSELEKAQAFPELRAELRLVIEHLEKEAR